MKPVFWTNTETASGKRDSEKEDTIQHSLLLLSRSVADDIIKNLS